MKVGDFSVFRGVNAVNLDSKGRMAMPTRYRTLLENDAERKVVVTIDTDEKCLLLYPLPEWQLIEKKIAALPSFNRAARRIQRLLIGHATEVELDANGRVLLPQLLRDYAELDKVLMLVGQGKKFEIWSEQVWQQRRDDWLSEKVEQLGEMPADLELLSL